MIEQKGNVMELVTVVIGTSALNDHLDRLYPVSDYPDHHHVDIDGAFIAVVNEGKRSSIIDISRVALEEFIDDLDYQIEFTDIPQYRAQCKRALAKLVTYRNGEWK
jgi:hypothetical protein